MLDHFKPHVPNVLDAAVAVPDPWPGDLVSDDPLKVQHKLVESFITCVDKSETLVQRVLRLICTWPGQTSTLIES